MFHSLYFIACDYGFNENILLVLHSLYSFHLVSYKAKNWHDNDCHLLKTHSVSLVECLVYGESLAPHGLIGTCGEPHGNEEVYMSTQKGSCADLHRTGSVQSQTLYPNK